MFGRRRRYKRVIPLNPRVQKIKTLSNSPALFYTEIFAPSSPNIDSCMRICELVKHTPEHIRINAQFHKHLGNAVVSLLESKISVKKQSNFGVNYSHTRAYPSLIRYCTQFINEDAKNRIVDLIIQHNRNFYTEGKKEIASIATDFIYYEDKRASDILRSFYRTIRKKDFEKLISRIPDGLDNSTVKEILSKSRLYDYLQYNEEKVNSDYNEKVKLVKAVAKTPTLIKRLPFVLNVELKHLKEVAPGMRFKFMQFAFRIEFNKSRNGWSFGRQLINVIDYSKRRVKEDKLVIEEISVEDMKELLFSVCLQKNDEFVKWINSYSLYLTCKHSPVKVDPFAKKLFM